MNTTELARIVCPQDKFSKLWKCSHAPIKQQIVGEGVSMIFPQHTQPEYFHYVGPALLPESDDPAEIARANGAAVQYVLPWLFQQEPYCLLWAANSGAYVSLWGSNNPFGEGPTIAHALADAVARLTGE